MNYHNYDNYNWIDNNVAIGNYLTPYDEFDVIVNLNYPYNGVAHHNIEIDDKNGKLIYRIGCYDSEDEEMTDLLTIIIPELLRLYLLDNNIKILFHCYAGISRSSTLAIAFLCMAKGYSLRDAYNLVKRKRPIVNPNKGFINSLQRYVFI
jgi:protein-tyrosine phosphatase